MTFDFDTPLTLTLLIYLELDACQKLLPVIIQLLMTLPYRNITLHLHKPPDPVMCMNPLTGILDLLLLWVLSACVDT